MNKVAKFIQEQVRFVPWSKGTWHGSFTTLDGTDTSDFGEDDVDESPEQLVGFRAAGVNDWDGDCSVVFRLKDGRWISYESTWGPTGSGFSEDAYGGNVDVLCSKDRETAIRMGISKTYQTALTDITSAGITVYHVVKRLEGKN